MPEQDDKEQRADYTLGVRLTEDEKETIERAADAEGFRNVSEWVRVTLKRAARLVLQPTEVRP